MCSDASDALCRSLKSRFTVASSRVQLLESSITDAQQRRQCTVATREILHGLFTLAATALKKAVNGEKRKALKKKDESESDENSSDEEHD